MSEMLFEALTYAAIGTQVILMAVFFGLVLLDWWRSHKQ